MTITLDEVNQAFVKWRQANHVAQTMSHQGLPQNQVDEFWKIEEQYLNEYSDIWSTYFEQKAS